MNTVVSAMPAPSIAPIVGFDYSALDSDTANAVMRAADTIKHRKTCVGQEIIGIGADLIEVKAKLGHGQFGRWLSAEFDWDERTARRFMSVAEAFADKTDSVSDLMPTTLYALAAPSVPATVREEVIERREMGERLADHIVKSMIKEAKRTQARKDRRRARKELREAHQSPAALKRAEKLRREEEERQRISNEALTKIAEIICNSVGDALPELLELWEQAGWGGWWRFPDELRKLVKSETADGISALPPSGGGAP